MKRLLLFIFFSLLSIQISVVILAIEAPTHEEVIETENAARDKRAKLEHNKDQLELKIKEQIERVNRASGDERVEEENDLNELDDMHGKAEEKIKSLSDVINELTKEEPISVDEFKAAKQEVTDAGGLITDAEDLITKLAEKLKSEFVPAEPDAAEKEKEMEEAQKEVEKLDWWESFQLTVNSFFKEVRATILEFLGAHDSAVAVRNDLNSIYEILKDYGAKAKNSGKLAQLYTDLGKLGDALKAQVSFLDSAVKDYSDKRMLISEMTSIAKNTLTDILTLQDKLYRGVFEPTDISPIDLLTMQAKIEDALGAMNLKVKASLYETLGIDYYKVRNLDPNAAQKEIRKAYLKAALKWHPDRLKGVDITSDIYLEYTEKFKEISNANTVLRDSGARKTYDSNIAYKEFIEDRLEIVKMTVEEKEVFDKKKQKQQEAEQADILGGG